MDKKWTFWNSARLQLLFQLQNPSKEKMQDAFVFEFQSELKLGFEFFFQSFSLFGFNRDIVELLLSYEASCNSADDKGSSPLHLAAWAGHAQIVEILMTRGPSIANVNLTVSGS